MSLPPDIINTLPPAELQKYQEYLERVERLSCPTITFSNTTYDLRSTNGDTTSTVAQTVLETRGGVTTETRTTTENRNGVVTSSSSSSQVSGSQASNMTRLFQGRQP